MCAAQTPASVSSPSPPHPPGEVPCGSEYTHTGGGTTPDGIWGERAEAAHDNTVGLIQAAVGAYQDEIYGAATNAAVSIALAGAETA